jgi:hypothetical protein
MHVLEIIMLILDKKMQVLQGIPNYECIDWTFVFHNWCIATKKIDKKKPHPFLNVKDEWG